MMGEGMVLKCETTMICKLCPHHCGAVRTSSHGTGICGAPWALQLGRASLHQWEEPCLVGEKGAGAVFFSGCNLKCVYCQNKPISHDNIGKIITIDQLQTIFKTLIDQGASCLDLVSPTHVTPLVAKALEMDIPIPVVWNSGGYESVETLKLLEGKVDVYLPDFKYAQPELAQAYSGAGDYFAVATAAILEMHRQTGEYVFENGLLKRGVLLRHLVLPGKLNNTKACLDWIGETFAPGQVLVSLMSQYTPQPGAQGNLARPVSRREYQAMVTYLQDCGIVDGYVQEESSAQAIYTPPFDLTGV